MKKNRLFLTILLTIAPAILRSNHKVIFRYPKESNMVLRIWFKDTANRPHYATIGENNGYTKKIADTNYKCREISIKKNNLVYPDIKDIYVDVWYKSIKEGNYRGRYHFEKNVKIIGDKNTEVFFKYDPKNVRPLQKKVVLDNKTEEKYDQSGQDNSSVRIIPDWIINNYVDPATDYQPWSKPQTINFVILPWKKEVKEIQEALFSAKEIKEYESKLTIDINANTTKSEIISSGNQKLFIKQNAGTIIGCQKDVTYEINIANSKVNSFIKSNTYLKNYELKVSKDDEATIIDPPLNF
ncbi:MAG: hypothetical protein ABIF12_01575 [bacterium]